MKVNRKILSMTIVSTMIIAILEPFSDVLDIETKAMAAYEPRNIETKKVAVGTTDNPFDVVEIVPDISMSKLMYLFEDKDISYVYDANETYSKIDYSKIKTKEDIEVLEEAKLISTKEDTPLKYSTKHEYKEEDDYNKLPESEKSDWKKSSEENETLKETGYFTYEGEDKGDYSLKSHETGYEYSEGGEYKENVEKYVWEGNGEKNYIAKMVYNEDDGDYVVKKVTKVNGSGDYDLVTYYDYNENGAEFVKFRYNPSTTKAVNRYKVKKEIKNDKGLYKKEEDKYVYSEEIKAGEERYNVIFEKDTKGEYTVESTDNLTENKEAKYNEEQYKACRYHKPERYVYNKDGTGDYDVMFEADKTSKDKEHYNMSTVTFSKGAGNVIGILKEGNEYIKVKDGEKGYYKLEMTYIFKYEGDNKGTFKWHKNNNYPSDYETPEYPKDGVFSSSVKIWKKSQTVYKDVYTKTTYEITTNNLFKKNVLGLSKEADQEKYNIKVWVCTPKGIENSIGITKENELNILEAADFIYVSDYTNKKYNGAFKVLTGDTAKENSFNVTNNDLKYKNIKCLMEQVATERKVPLVIDYKKDSYNVLDKATADGTTIKLYQLPLFTAIYGSARFYNYFMNDFGDSETVTAIDKDGKYVEISSDKFSDWTFIPDNVADVKFSKENLQNTLGIKIGDMAVGSEKNKFDYTRSVIENVYFNIQGDGNEIFNENFIKKENYKDYDKKDKAFKGIDTENLSPANICKYLVEYKDKNKSVEKEKMTILDIEPCGDYTTPTSFKLQGDCYSEGFDGTSKFIISYKKDKSKSLKDNLKYAYFRSLMPNYYGCMDIIEETSSEFVGDIEDLNTTYDLIYIGTNTGKLNIKDKKTVYNDSNMNGLLYSHMGDKVVGNKVLSGLIGSVKDGEVFRMSGNDITEYTVKKLTEYVDAGYPVLAEQQVYNADTGIIDKSSQIYKFLSANRDKMISITDVANGIKEKELRNMMSKRKIKINLTSKPAEYEKKSDGTIVYNNNGFSTESGGSIVAYTFSIDDDGGTESSLYVAKLLIDVDADGTFEQTETIRTIKNLKKGKEYTLDKTLTRDFTGVVPWKLQVSRMDGNGIYRAEEKGYTCIKCPETDKRELKILQIATDTTTQSYTSKITNGVNTTGRKSNFDMEKQFYDKSTKFYKYSSNLDDFKFVVDSVSVTEFVKQFTSDTTNITCDGSKQYIVKDKIYENNGVTLKTHDYDMLVVGFADCYVDFYSADASEECKKRAVKNIQQFIDKGRGVLFSHDTTSFINQDYSNTTDSNASNYMNKWPYGTGTKNWGYSINKFLRARLGTDRYGVTQTTQNLGDEKKVDQKFDYSKLKGNSNNEIQGYSYSTLGRNSDTKKNTYGLTTNKSAFYYGNNQTTKNVTMVNEGQITNYPYKLNKTITISQTHAPYYQLNLEQEGAVVWYCLKETSGDSAGKIYSESPNDMRNFYYIYSFGNITYTGAGHSKFAETEDEVKLFVNTIIAAYRSEKEDAKITVENSSGQVTDANGTTDVIYAYFDKDNETKTLEDENLIDVVFSVDDANLSSDEMTLKLERLEEDDKGIYHVKGIMDSSTIRLLDEYNNTETSSGGTYKINKATLYTLGIKTSRYMDGKDYCLIKLTATSSDGKEVSNNVKVIRRSVFDME